MVRNENVPRDVRIMRVESCFVRRFVKTFHGECHRGSPLLSISNAMREMNHKVSLIRKP